MEAFQNVQVNLFTLIIGVILALVAGYLLGYFLRKIFTDFQIKEAELGPGSHCIERKLSLQDLSTRKHHPGKHELAIVVNGVEQASTSFQLT